jgi:hypothetical protein
VRYVILSGLDHGYIVADGKDRSGQVLTAFEANNHLGTRHSGFGFEPVR